MNTTPQGITPPSPGMDREEPDLWREDDIPADDGTPAATEGRSGARSGGEESSRKEPGQREERPLRKVERE